MDKKIPAQVLKEAEGLIKMYWENIKYLGTYMNIEYYQFIFPKSTKTGYPFLYIYFPKNWEVKEITGFSALDIIEKLYKQ